MKIKEAVDIINSTTTVKANHCYSDIFVCSKWASLDKCFLMIHDHTKTWGGVTLVSSAIYDVIPEDLARVMDVVQRLLDTPVKERFPEKKYRLVANPNSLEQAGTYATKYVECIQDSMDSFSFAYGGPTVFSEKELKQIEELHPRIAPAIEAMKEDVDDNEKQD